MAEERAPWEPASTDIDEQTLEQETAPWGDQQPAPKKEGEDQNWFMGMLDTIVNGASFGSGDEMVAFEAAVLGKTSEKSGLFDVGHWKKGKYFDSFWDRYRTAKNAERGQRETFEEENPVASKVGEIGGMVASSIAAAPLAALGKTVSPIVQATRGGAAGGLLSGIGEGEGLGDTTIRAGAGMVLGGVAGAVAGKLTDAGTKYFKKVFNKSPAKVADEMPTVKQLDKAAQRAYDNVDDLGVRYEPGYTAQKFTELRGLVEKSGAETDGNKAVYKLLDKLDTWGARKKPGAPGGADITPRDLQGMRQRVFKKLMSRGGSDRHYGGMILDKIDDLMEDALKLRGVKVAEKNASKVRSTLRGADKAYGRARKVELIDDALHRAIEKTQKTYSGGNLDNNIRAEMDRLLNTPRYARYFTDAAENAALKKSYMGSNLTNFYRRIGKMAPTGGLMGVINLAGAIGTAGATIPLSLGAMAAKKLGEHGTKKAVETARKTVTGTLPPPVPPVPILGAGAAGAVGGGLLGQMFSDAPQPR